MPDIVRIQVLLPRDEADRFSDYCREMGFKKSTLIARLVRDYMIREGFRPQGDLFDDTDAESAVKRHRAEEQRAGFYLPPVASMPDGWGEGEHDG